jgi:hypothetical protein
MAEYSVSPEVNTLNGKVLHLEKYSAKGVWDLAEWHNTF